MKLKYLKTYELFEKKINKKDAKLFKSEIKKIIEDKFDIQENTPSSHYDYIIETKAGKLNIKISVDDSEVYTIFMRFENIEEANKLKLTGTLNNYSGKWNIHTSDMETAISEFKERMDSIKLK